MKHTIVACLAILLPIAACGAPQESEHQNERQAESQSSTIAPPPAQAAVPSEGQTNPAEEREEEMTKQQILAMQAQADARFRKQPGAYVNYDAAYHKLMPYGSCGAGSDGSYNTWAMTMLEDEPDIPDNDKSRVHVYGTPDQSRIDFYLSGLEPTVSLRQSGDDRVAFGDGYYAFDGETGESPERSITIRIQCP